MGGPCQGMARPLCVPYAERTTPPAHRHNKAPGAWKSPRGLKLVAGGGFEPPNL